MSFEEFGAFVYEYIDYYKQQENSIKTMDVTCGPIQVEVAHERTKTHSSSCHGR